MSKKLWNFGFRTQQNAIESNDLSNIRRHFLAKNYLKQTFRKSKKCKKIHHLNNKHNINNLILKIIELLTLPLPFKPLPTPTASILLLANN